MTWTGGWSVAWWGWSRASRRASRRGYR